jgi:transcriptional regulator with XRE-family HTH domain
MEIGQKIKQLRVKYNLTLEELASRTELSKGFLSQLERDLTSPSIATLEDIVLALGSDLEHFFKEDSDDQVCFKEVDFFVDKRENCKVSWIVPNAQKNEMEPILLDLPQGGISHEIKPHEGEEFGYVLLGKVLLVNLENNQEHHLKKGETFYIKGDFLHVIKNESIYDAKLLWICTPPIF